MGAVNAGTPTALMSAPLETGLLLHVVSAGRSVDPARLYRDRGACGSRAGTSAFDSTFLTCRDGGRVAGEGARSCRAGTGRSACGTLFVHRDMAAGEDRHCHPADRQGSGVRAICDDTRALSCRTDTPDPCRNDRAGTHATGGRAGVVRVVTVLSGTCEARSTDVAMREDRGDPCNGEKSRWSDSVQCDRDREVGTTGHKVTL